MNDLKGKRIQVIEMGQDEPNPLKEGEKGTVVFTDDLGTIHVKWDSGRTIGLVPESDSFKII